MAEAVSSPFTKTYAAAAVLAAMAAYIFFVERPRGDDPLTQNEKAFSFEADAVTSITIEKDDGSPIHVQREGESWKIVSPLEAPADADAVESLVSDVVGLEIEEVIAEEPGDLAAFGLGEPRLSVQVTLKGTASPVRVSLGEKAPDGSIVYGRISGAARIVALPTSFETALDKKPFDLRDRDVLHVDRDDIQTIRIEGPEGGYAIARRGEQDWAFTDPLETQAARWSISTLLSSLEGLEMDAVAAEPAGDLDPFGLDTPARRIEVGLKDGHTRTLEIGSKTADGKYHAREVSRDLVAVIPAGLVDELAKGMAELREKRIADIATYEVDLLVAELSDQTRRYERSDGEDSERKWRRTEPDAADVERTKVDDVLFDLGGIDVEEFIDAPDADANYGFDVPAAVISLHQEEKGDLKLVIGKTDDTYYARRPGDASVLKLATEPVEKVLKALEEL